MPILLFVGVGCAIAVLVLAVHLAGGTGAQQLPDVEALASAFAEVHRGVEVDEVVVDPDGRTAILALGDGGLGAVVAVGLHHATRRWGPGEVAVAAGPGDASVEVHTRDPGLGRLRVRLTAPADLERWLRRGAGVLLAGLVLALPRGAAWARPAASAGAGEAPPSVLSGLPDPVLLAIPAFVGLILLELVLWRGTAWGRDHLAYETRDTATSLTMGVLNLASGVLAGGAIVAVHAFVWEHRLMDLGTAWWVWGLCFLAEDHAYYWFHRMAHERRWLWASHVTHHSSQHYNLSTALRQPVFSIVSLGFVFWLPLTWLGFHPLMVGFFGGISLVYQFWIHTEALRRLGPLEWVMNTPSHHRVHHGTNPRYLDANYAGILIVWDRLYGTFVPEDDAEPVRYGLVSQLGTHHPVRVAFHEWAAIGRDVASARSLRELLGVTCGPPGWKADGTGRTTAVLKREAGISS